MINNKELGAYRQEVSDALARLRQETDSSPELEYFFSLAEGYFAPEQMQAQSPRVVVLGTSVPEELIYAAGAVPFWVPGGSTQAGAWAGDLVPRDTDPVSRAMLGFLENEWFAPAHRALVVIPVVNDSSRKLAYLLKRMGRKVYTIDFPPVKSPCASEAWQRQIERLGEALSAHTGKPITRRSLRQAMQAVARCRMQMRRFLTLAQGKLSGACRMFVLGSYYYAINLTEWREHLEALNKALAAASPQHRKHKNKGNILLLGSPVYFPGYKIPFLIEDAGLHIYAQIDYTTQKIFGTDTQLFYPNDCSGAYVRNDTLLHAVTQMITHTPIDGVIYQVLKGQIEYDFELERMETLFASYDLPVFRLETDYNPQDVEQLCIRTDAFTEMLAQRRYRREAQAV